MPKIGWLNGFCWTMAENEISLRSVLKASEKKKMKNTNNIMQPYNRTLGFPTSKRGKMPPISSVDIKCCASNQML